MSLLSFAVLALTAEGEEGSTRRSVFRLVSEHPGLHQRDIARRLEIHPGTAEHHLRHLARAGLLERQESGGFVRFYPAVKAPGSPGIGRAVKPVLALLRQRRPLEVVARLLQGDAPMGSLASAMGISGGTLTHHVKRLEKAGLVHRYREGNSRLVGLVDRTAVIETLLAYEPPADLVAGFEDIWDEFGA